MNFDVITTRGVTAENNIEIMKANLANATSIVANNVSIIISRN